MAWGDEVVEKINQLQPDILLTAAYATNIGAELNQGESGKAALARGISTRLFQINGAKTKIITMAQLPIQTKNFLECLKSTQVDSEISMSNADGLTACGTTRTEALRREDPMVAVAAELPNVEYLNLTDMICSPTFCPTVQGNILTFKDQGHVTASYMMTLEPILGIKIDETLGIDFP